MPTYRHGRHEHGQNFLTDQSTISTITQLVAATEGPIIEIGPGDGALTIPLAQLGRPVTAVEIDARHARRLGERLPSHVDVVADDFLAYRLPTSLRIPMCSSATYRSTRPQPCFGACCTRPHGQMQSCSCNGKSPGAELALAVQR